MKPVANLAVWSLLTIVFVPGCGKGPVADESPGAVPAAAAEPDGVAVPGQIAVAQKPFAVLPRVAIEPRWPAFQDLGMKEVTLDSLARIGHDAVPALVRLLRESESSTLRVQAATALARMGPDAAAAAPALIVALDDPDESVRKNAIRALGQIGPAASKSVPALVDILKRLDAESEK